ncbi:hypothetical protein QA645_19485 [Bradyrhizobium sp. CIAT3101]|uniref:hypothetical protein n=1 Tax=Bradyrhizobium sp. CIAT3101 TaxID=439387 RepID=UPI0024B0A9F3|nr:hypothetical protein [Bradyrhizobium sp. CIAT3101]WFU84839.1 hypothetical protein QA645_19485 [Bradyrhizobium sp. CIAT3101]
MRNMNRDVPRLSNPNFGSLNIRPEGAGGDPGFARVVAENQLARWQVVVDQIRELTPRYEAAREKILALRPTEAVRTLCRTPGLDASAVALEAMVDENLKLVLGLEAQAEDLEHERVAKMSETERLRLEVDELKGLARAMMARISILEGRSPDASTVLSTRESRTAAPMIVPPGGAPGLGGVSASFAVPPAGPGGGDVRRVGSKPG